MAKKGITVDSLLGETGERRRFIERDGDTVDRQDGSTGVRETVDTGKQQGGQTDKWETVQTAKRQTVTMRVREHGKPSKRHTVDIEGIRGYGQTGTDFKKTTIKITPERFRNLKMFCAEHDLTFQDLFTFSIDKTMKDIEKGGAKGT